MSEEEVGVRDTPGSNFWRGPNRVTGEHDFQSRKTHDLKWKTRILVAPTPGEAKRLGRRAPLREDWEQVKLDEMRDVVLRKALSEPDFVDWLRQTGTARIVEYNTWHDNVWGICTCNDCQEKSASNLLGKVLMEIRELVVSYEYEPS
jgi:ribA/ribD-fused uncharacterized protein